MHTLAGLLFTGVASDVARSRLSGVGALSSRGGLNRDTLLRALWWACEACGGVHRAAGKLDGDQPSIITDRVERRTKLPSSCTLMWPVAVEDAADALVRRLGFFVLVDRTYRTTTAMAASAKTTSAGTTSGVARISAAVFAI